MSDKKIIITSVVLSLVLIIGGWIYSKNKPANIPNPGPAAVTQTQQTNAAAGIVLGSDNAPVVMEEYTNFLCSACGNFATQTLPQIQENYIKTGKVKMVFYIYPPLELGRAAYCVSKQDKFVEYHDYLFAHQDGITQEQDILDFATNIGVDQASFNECYNSDEAKNAAQSWLDEGQNRGVEATPTFFINGEKFVGAQPYADFEKIIEGKLK